MNKKNLAIIFFLLSPSTFADKNELILITIADATVGSKQYIPATAPTPSLGAMFVFDQPLKNEDMTEVLGTNSGFCIATKPGVYSQCQWTLTLQEGTITVAGQEYETGTSVIPIIGTTGIYAKYKGELRTTPNPNFAGTYIQILYFYLKLKN